MPRVPQLVSDLAIRYGLDDRTLAGKARALREAGLLTSGAHGVNAPAGTSLDAARLLLAVLADGRTTTVVDDVRYLATLPARTDGSKYAYAEEAVAALIEEVGKGHVGDPMVAVSNGPKRVQVRGTWDGEPFDLWFDNLGNRDAWMKEPFNGLHKKMTASAEGLTCFSEVVAGHREPGKVDTDEEWAARYRSEADQ
jgi:hypothetical protein